MPKFPKGANLKGGRNAAPVLAEMAREFYAPIIPIVMELHNQGLSLRAIGRELDRRGIRTRQESSSAFMGVDADCKPIWDTTINRWSAAQVRRVLARGLAAAEARPEPQDSPACETAPRA